MQYLKRQNRQSVLAVDIPGNFNQFYRQDPRVEMYLSISVYIDVYTGTEMFGLEWTKGWLMEIWAECDSRSAKSVNRRGRKYRFWNTQRSRSASSTAFAVLFRCVWLHPRVCTSRLHQFVVLWIRSLPVNERCFQSEGYEGGRCIEKYFILWTYYVPSTDEMFLVCIFICRRIFTLTQLVTRSKTHSPSLLKYLVRQRNRAFVTSSNGFHTLEYDIGRKWLEEHLGSTFLRFTQMRLNHASRIVPWKSILCRRDCSEEQNSRDFRFTIGQNHMIFEVQFNSGKRK